MLARIATLVTLVLFSGCADSESLKLQRYMAARAEIVEIDEDNARSRRLFDMEVNYPRETKKVNDVRGKVDWTARIAENEETRGVLLKIMRDNRPSTILNK